MLEKLKTAIFGDPKDFVIVNQNKVTPETNQPA